MLLLALAFADKALFGFDSLDDFWKQEIPPGEYELVLRWKDEAMNASADFAQSLQGDRHLPGSVLANRLVPAHIQVAPS